MKFLCYLSLLWLVLLTACTSDNDKHHTQNTLNTQNGKIDYVINPPDFEALEKQKATGVKSQAAAEKKKAAEKKREDSVKTYIKKLTHHFHLAEKQMKALEYIYDKYATKEAAAKAQKDNAQLKRMVAEKEKRIEVVMGEIYYANKAAFDASYLTVPKTVTTAKNDQQLEQYLRDLSRAIVFNDQKKAALKRLLKSYDKSISKAKRGATKVLKKKRKEAIKNLLGEDLFNQKTAFDKTYPIAFD